MAAREHLLKMKRTAFLLAALLLLAACGRQEAAEPTESTPPTEETEMILRIDGTVVPVTWEENESAQALLALAPLTIEMSMYGGFEQVGSIGTSLPRSDRQTATAPGDLVLYAGNQLVVFYGTNQWAYTRLGHVDLTRVELEALLADHDVRITLEAKK